LVRTRISRALQKVKLARGARHMCAHRPSASAGVLYGVRPHGECSPKSNWSCFTFYIFSRWLGQSLSSSLSRMRGIPPLTNGVSPHHPLTPTNPYLSHRHRPRALEAASLSGQWAHTPPPRRRLLLPIRRRHDADRIRRQGLQGCRYLPPGACRTGHLAGCASARELVPHGVEHGITSVSSQLALTPILRSSAAAYDLVPTHLNSGIRTHAGMGSA
jgi:hypothetical protein